MSSGYGPTVREGSCQNLWGATSRPHGPALSIVRIRFNVHETPFIACETSFIMRETPFKRV